MKIYSPSEALSLPVCGSSPCKKRQQGEDVLLPLIRRWQEDGVMIDERPEVLTGLIRLFTIAMKKK
jgi:hypothetical protein